MRRSATSTVPPKMYRHFAAVTVLLTATLALFAEGPPHAAAVDRVDKQPHKTEPQPEGPSTFSPATGTEGPDLSTGQFGDDSGPFGTPMDNPAGGRSSSVVLASETLHSTPLSPQYLASLDELEREMLLQGLRENGMLSDDIRQHRTAALMAASENRSGPPSSQH
jgi:hypothetical protein